MKAFVILTACMMATAGATYYYSTDTCTVCSLSITESPVATSGGCCAKHSAKKLNCCESQDESNVTVEACSAIATSAIAAKKTDCCATKADCCPFSECCATAAKFITAMKKRDCCAGDAACVTADQITSAAKSIAGVR